MHWIRKNLHKKIDTTKNTESHKALVLALCAPCTLCELFFSALPLKKFKMLIVNEQLDKVFAND